TANDPSQLLIGVWEVTKAQGPPPGATVEFTKDGKLKLCAKVGDNTLDIDGTYKLHDKTITVTLSFGGKTRTESAKINKLTDQELIVEDKKGMVEEYKRVKR